MGRENVHLHFVKLSHLIIIINSNVSFKNYSRSINVVYERTFISRSFPFSFLPLFVTAKRGQQFEQTFPNPCEFYTNENCAVLHSTHTKHEQHQPNELKLNTDTDTHTYTWTFFGDIVAQFGRCTLYEFVPTTEVEVKFCHHHPHYTAVHIHVHVAESLAIAHFTHQPTGTPSRPDPPHPASPIYMHNNMIKTIVEGPAMYFSILIIPVSLCKITALQFDILRKTFRRCNTII